MFNYHWCTVQTWKQKESLRWGFCHPASYFGVPVFELWSRQKAMYFPPFSFIVHDSTHILYKTLCNNFLTSTGYPYFWSCLKFSTIANELMNSPFPIYVAVARQGLLVTKRTPSASKEDRMQNLFRKSVSTSSICVHFIRFEQRKKKTTLLGGGGCGR